LFITLTGFFAFEPMRLAFRCAASHLFTREPLATSQRAHEAWGRSDDGALREAKGRSTPRGGRRAEKGFGLENMCGFIFGTLCLIAFVKLSRRGCCGGGWGWRRRWGGGCYGGRCYGGHGGWGHEGWRGGPVGGPFGGDRWMLRALFERLDTTPGQEKVIVAAVDESREAMREAWQAVRDSRDDVARALRSETFDEAAVKAARSRHESAMQRAHEALEASLRKVHEALDGRQRALLAEMLEAGPWAGPRASWRGGFHPGGPYRSA
jgi:Spy/CpxP family protein refolding chaperone